MSPTPTAQAHPPHHPRQGVPDLFHAPFTHELWMGAPGSPEPDWLALPASPGVVVFESEGSGGGGGGAVLIGTTADVRAFTRTRLGDAPGGAPGRVRYRELTARVRVTAVGSSLEADAVYLGHARRLLPDSYRVVSERWRAWYAHVDPGATYPRWSKTNLLGLVGVRAASEARRADAPGGTGVLLGPIPDKDAAGRFIEAVIDAFDLCRYHHLLVQAPSCAPCAYKEMGRCPAPCDGSETMSDYRARTLSAIATISGGSARLDAARAPIDADMHAGAARGDFEGATLAKAKLDRLAALGARAFGAVRRLDEFAPVLILASGRARVARVVVLSGGRLLALASVSAGGTAAGMEALCESVRRHATGIGGTGGLGRNGAIMEEGAVDALAVLSRWMFLPASRRRGVLLHALGPGADIGAEALTDAVRAVCVKRAESPGLIADQEIEAV